MNDRCRRCGKPRGFCWCANPDFLHPDVDLAKAASQILNKKQCRGCRFWTPDSPEHREGGWEHMSACCKCGSPQVVPHYIELSGSSRGNIRWSSVWPVTTGQDWCYRWESVRETPPQECLYQCENCCGSFPSIHKVLLPSGHDLWCCEGCKTFIGKI